MRVNSEMFINNFLTNQSQELRRTVLWLVVNMHSTIHSINYLVRFMSMASNLNFSHNIFIKKLLENKNEIH